MKEHIKFREHSHFKRPLCKLKINAQSCSIGSKIGISGIKALLLDLKSKGLIIHESKTNQI